MGACTTPRGERWAHTRHPGVKDERMRDTPGLKDGRTHDTPGVKDERMRDTPRVKEDESDLQLLVRAI